MLAFPLFDVSCSFPLTVENVQFALPPEVSGGAVLVLWVGESRVRIQSAEAFPQLCTKHPVPHDRVHHGLK